MKLLWLFARALVSIISDCFKAALFIAVFGLIMWAIDKYIVPTLIILGSIGLLALIIFRMARIADEAEQPKHIPWSKNDS
jgi:hypothetical protein